MEYRYKKLAEYIRGWMNYYGISEYYRPIPLIDEWLRRRGPWHLARTMAAQSGMTNKWLAEQGLISVKEQWVNIHYPATAR
jgi:RNA-directed DNA polymerase